MIRDPAAMRRSFARTGIKLAQGEVPDERRVGVDHGKLRRIGSGGQPLVTMMQAADLGKGDDGSGAARLNRPGDRTVLAQSQMRARAVIIGDVRRKDPPQMRLVEDDDVVKALSPDRADDPFDERALPGRARCRHNVLDAHGLDPGAEHQTVDAVPVSDHVAWRRVPREGFCDLLTLSLLFNRSVRA